MKQAIRSGTDHARIGCGPCRASRPAEQPCPAPGSFTDWPLRPAFQSGTGSRGPRGRLAERASGRPLTCGLVVNTPCPNQGPHRSHPGSGLRAAATGQPQRAAGVNLVSRVGTGPALTSGQDPEHDRHESLPHEATPRAASPCGCVIPAIRATGVNRSSRIGIAPALMSGREPEHSRHESLRREAAPGAERRRGGAIRRAAWEPR